MLAPYKWFKFYHGPCKYCSDICFQWIADLGEVQLTCIGQGLFCKKVVPKRFTNICKKKLWKLKAVPSLRKHIFVNKQGLVGNLITSCLIPWYQTFCYGIMYEHLNCKINIRLTRWTMHNKIRRSFLAYDYSTKLWRC